MRPTKDRATPKLTLHTETLRRLTGNQLRRAAGGTDDYGGEDYGWGGDGGYGFAADTPAPDYPTLTNTLDDTVDRGPPVSVGCSVGCPIRI